LTQPVERLSEHGEQALAVPSGSSHSQTPGAGQALGRGVHGILRIARRKPMATLSAVMILAILAFVAVGPYLSGYTALDSDTSAILAKPGPQHWFGTDQYGRDVFTRIAAGGRISLSVGIGVVILSSLLGTTIGLISGYLGGTVDFVLQRFVDAEMSIPTLLLLMVIGVVLGHGIAMLILAIGILSGMRTSRVVRSAVLGVMTMPYVEAAATVGASDARVVLRHVLPNIVAPLLVIASVGIAQAIILESTLSFLGYGVSPPDPSWGGMLGGSSRRFMYQAPWLPIFPAAALALTVYAFNMLGDGLRDILDPRLRLR
jgi:peptide/nickel transport system permease protein